MQNCMRHLLRHVSSCKGNLGPMIFTNKRIFTNTRIRKSSRIIGNKQFSTVTVAQKSSLKPKTIVNIQDLFKYLNEGKQFYLKLLINVSSTIKYDDLSTDQIILLLKCCGSSVPDSSREIRNVICQDIFKNVLNAKNVDLDIYHTYITVCTDNSVVINSKEFLKSVLCEPNQLTYKLLLKNSCEKGQTEQGFQILEMMKNNNMAADEDVFNAIVFAHTLQSGIKAAESVLHTMRVAQVAETINTKLSILRAVILRGVEADFQEALDKFSTKFPEDQFLEIIECLGLSGNHAWLREIQSLSHVKQYSREFLSKLEKLCIHFVHMNKPESAMVIYQHFFSVSPDQKYGFFLLKEMLHCNISIDVIIKLAKQLRNAELDVYSLENLAGLALRHNYLEPSWKLLENLRELRPHFFWPLIIDAYRNNADKGIMDVLQKMYSLNVKIDSQTLTLYVFPFCDLSNIKFILNKLQTMELTIRELLSPLLVVLLQHRKTKLAVEMYQAYNVQIDGESLFKLLSSSWASTKDSKSVVFLLQKFCESNRSENDLVGEFLIKTLRLCATPQDFQEYNKLLQLVNEKKLKINSASLEILHTLCAKLNSKEQTKITDSLDSLLDFGLKSEGNPIPHPRNMNVEELECHLVELHEKNMEVRGVLRKLIQQHSNEGNLQRVEELRKQFTILGYEESAGMKSSLMYNYVQGEQVDEALGIYRELKAQYHKFNLDSFKILDLAALLVKNNMFSTAMDILKTESDLKRVIGGPSIVRNCWKLLGSFKDDKEQLQMLDFLLIKGYCKPSNVLLGPLVKLHLNNGDLNKAVNVFARLAQDYKHTPLQFELLCASLDAKDQVLFKKVVDCTQAVHGEMGAAMAVISALAEKGLTKPLMKVLTSTSVSVKYDLKKRCERWLKEGKIMPLETLQAVSDRLPADVVDVNFVCSCIMKIHELNNDCEAAIKFYQGVSEGENNFLSKNLEKDLQMLLKKCNYKMSKSVEMNISK